MRMGARHYGAMTPNEKDRQRYATDDGKKRMKQGDLNYYAPYPSQSDQQLRIDMAITHMLVRTNLPFAHVANPAFIDFVQTLIPRARVKTPKCFAYSKVPLLFTDVKTEVDTILANELPDVGVCSLAVDFWTSKISQLFFNVEIQYVSKDFVFRHYTQEFKHWEKREFAADIAEGFRDVIGEIAGVHSNYFNREAKREYDEERLAKLKENPEAIIEAFERPFQYPTDSTKIYIVADGDPKMKAGIRLLQNGEPAVVGTHHCIGHQLELVLKNAFSSRNCDEFAKDAIHQVTKLAGRLNQSGPSTQVMVTEGKEIGGNFFIYNYK